MAFMTPDDEIERLNALNNCLLLNSEADPSLNNLVQLLSQKFQTPVAHLSFMGADHQYIKAHIGFDLTEVPRDKSFCNYVIFKNSFFCIEDSLANPEFALNPFVSNLPHIRFYAGAPLRSSSGFAIGTLCIMDTVARKMDKLEIELLQAFAGQASLQLQNIELNHCLDLSIKKQNAFDYNTKSTNTVGAFAGNIILDLIKPIETIQNQI